MGHVNHEHKHVFVHVPRCAGVSMARQEFVGGGVGHARIVQLKTRLLGDLGGDAAEAAKYFSWGFVRHPFDRLHSGYYHVRDVQPSWLTRTMISFEQFVLGLADYFHERPFSRTATHYLCWNDGDLGVDFVGKYENLQADWAEVCQRIGVPVTPLPKSNATHSKEKDDWREEFTSAMKVVAFEVYRVDFEKFGYDPEL